MATELPPVHPGEVLLAEFLEPTGLSQYRLAKDVSVPPRRINEIVHGKRAVTADTALRLARYFGTTPRFWLNLQTQHDLDIEADQLGDRLDREVTATTPTSWSPTATPTASPKPATARGFDSADGSIAGVRARRRRSTPFSFGSCPELLAADAAWACAQVVGSASSTGSRRRRPTIRMATTTAPRPSAASPSTRLTTPGSATKCTAHQPATSHGNKSTTAWICRVRVTPSSRGPTS